jgi:hypothetical protein
MKNPKITLLMTGQFERNLVTNDFLEIIEFHKKIFKFDNVICHLWNEEYEKIKDIQIPDYITIINDQDSLPFDENLQPYVSNEEHTFHAESVLICLSQTEVFDTSHTMAGALASLKQIYALSRIYDYALKNCDSDIYIRSRYDNNYIFSPNYDKLYEYLKSNKPVIFVPKSSINFALPDICYFMNRSALENFEDYFTTCRNYSFDHRVFWSEICLRFHINNIKKMTLYRFNFPCYVYRWFKDTGEYNCGNYEFSRITRDVKPFKANGMRSADYVI